MIDISTLKRYSFSSPGYPYGYGENLKCEWIFSTIPQNQLSVDFTAIDVYNAYGSVCYGDTVGIYIGVDGTQTWNLVSNFCTLNGSNSNKIPPSNILKIVFTTDTYGNNTGFSASVKEGKL